MKNTKKTNCKCTPNWTTYTPGKNAFGEDAYTEYIVVKRETAFEQILAAIRTFDEPPKNSLLTLLEINPKLLLDVSGRVLHAVHCLDRAIGEAIH